MSTATLPLPPQQTINITDRTVCISVTFGALGNQRKVNTADVEVDAEKTWIHVSKTLLDSPELKAIHQHRRAVKDWILTLALPSLFKSGIYLVPIPAVQQIQEHLTEAQGKDIELVEKFLDSYARAKQQAETRLKGLYNPQDYPPIGAVRRAFVFEWQYISFNTPTQLRDISASFFEHEQQKAAAKWAQATDEITLLLRRQFKELVDHINERLTPDDDGKPKRFQASTLDKIKVFLENFQIRNVTNDEQLKQLIDSTQYLLQSDPDAQALRDSEHLRASMQKGFAIIKQHLDPLVEEAGTRMITFERE